MAKHSHEEAFYRDTAPAVTPDTCVHNGGQYHNRFGDVVCAICDSPVGWHPDLVRPGVFGAGECEYHGEITCDCGTDDYRIERLDRIIGNVNGQRSLRIGQRYFDSLGREPWPLSENPHIAIIGELKPVGINFLTLNRHTV
jgi:hypothetical protein